MRYLLLVPEKIEFNFEAKLCKAMQGFFAIANVTAGQTLLEQSGK